MKTSMLEMEVVDMRKLNGDGNLKAFADVKVGGSLIIRGFSVVQGKKGVFASMPRKAGKDGRWFDTLEPVNEDIRKELQEKVLEAYEEDKED